jgi:prepilin signal peptidase PulO-like enzyme (type II secretory pathway)
MNGAIITIFVGLLGAAMASFAGALVWRLHSGKPFVKARSECERCHHILNVLDLVPVFSFLFLRGRCRYCHKKIHLSTLIIELVGVIAFVLSYLFFPSFSPDIAQNTVLLMIWFVLLTGFLILALYDIKYSLLPDRIIRPTLAAAAIFCATKATFTDTGLWEMLAGFSLALLPVSGFYLVLWILGEKLGKPMIGLGDVKLGAIFALLLTWQENVTVLILANILGAIVATILLLTKKVGRHSTIPFGPFLLLSALVVFLGRLSIEKVIAFVYNI